MSSNLVIFLPYRGEFGHLLMWHAPTVNAHEGKKIVCCEFGQEALFPGALEYIYVNPRPEDENKTANAHSYDTKLFEEIKNKHKKRFPDAKFIAPVGELKVDNSRKYFSYQPFQKQGIECDIVVCPRKRVIAPDRNWDHWIELTKKLQENGYSVCAVGSPIASYDVPCQKAWSYERFLDSTIEAIQKCKLVICTDSGLAHLAVQCGKPILMITFNGQPGPETKWKVKWSRYEMENHCESKIKNVDAWNDLELVFGTALNMVNEISQPKNIIDQKRALNIGCGQDIKTNQNGFAWTNIDIRQTESSVEKVDVFGRLPYDNNEFDYVLANDILEHHSYRRTEEVLKEWVRVLKSKGDIFIQVPCLTTIIQKFNSKKITEDRLVELLYGGQNYQGDDWMFNVHYNCFSENIIKKLANNVNLSIISMENHGNNLNVLLKKS